MGLFQISDLNFFSYFSPFFLWGLSVLFLEPKGWLWVVFGDASLLVLNYDCGFYSDWKLLYG